MRSLPAAIAVTLLCVLAGCSSTGDEATRFPAPATTGEATPQAPTGSPAPQDAAQACIQSFAPLDAVQGPTVERIRKRGSVVIGVSADTMLLSAPNPNTAELEGLDTALARAVGQRLAGKLGVPLVLRPITAADRITMLNNPDPNASVDLVVRAMTISCARWQEVNFSAVYLVAGQKVLVPKGTRVTGLQDLNGKRVCAPDKTSSMETILRTPGLTPVPRQNHTSCLIAVRENAADAVLGDDVILAGLAAQDSRLEVAEMKAITQEPYGIAVPKGDTSLTSFVNLALEQAKSDPQVQNSYRVLAAASKSPAESPAPIYGRQ